MKLTKRDIDAARYEGEGNARCVLWDDEVPGFGCRVYPGGRKAFILSYRVGGRKRLLTIGTYGVLTLAQGRKAARSELAKVETDGADPVATREQERQGETMRDLCAAYMDRHGNAKKSGSEDQRRIDAYVLPKWASLKARAELRLPDTKAGRVHSIPLSPPAVALLRDLPREDDNPFILPGKLSGAHLVNVDKPWNRVRAAAGVEDVRLRDLRRTVGSWLAQSGSSLHLIDRVLNHSNQSTTADYARFGDDSVRAALDQHGARIMGAAGLTTTAEVTRLPTRCLTAAK